MSNGVAWSRLAERYGEFDDVLKQSAQRAQYILEDFNPSQRVLVVDPSIFKAGRCPRGSGKSHAATGYAMYVGENQPNQRVLLIGLTLKAAKENFWDMAPGGVQVFNLKYGLGLDINMSNVSWRHQNGSVGHLAGADSAADLERLRGSKVEADLIIVDECKSFAPGRLKALIQDILMPGLARRGGTLVLIGTPGSIPEGIFWEATCPTAMKLKPKADPNEDDVYEPTCIPWERRHEKLYQGLTTYDDILETEIPRWSLHSWTLQDNLALPKLYQRALLMKRMNGWDDNHPAWRREFLGEWVEDASDLVYAYAGLRSGGKVTWRPTKGGDAWGLPKDGGPWHLILGMDFGYEDDFALCVLAYGEHDRTLYHVWEYKENHLTFERMVEEVRAAQDMFGGFETIVADAGGLGKVLVESMMSQGIPVIRAEKAEKFDHIELVNSDFHAGRLRILADSDLEAELCGLQWDLSKAAKELLVRTGKLKESPACPNHLCDAMLYVWRYAYHAFGQDRVAQIVKGSEEWWTTREAAYKKSFEIDPNADPLDTRMRKRGKVDHLIWR